MKVADVREEKGKEGIDQLHHVAKILSQVRHPHVIRLYEVLQTDRRYYAVVLELAGGGTLEQYVRMKGGYLTEQTSRQWFYQLLSALHHLHDRGVVHRNLHPAKILFDDKRRNLKISDFKYAYNYNHETVKYSRSLRIHQYNNAPELQQDDLSYHPTSLDIWALGNITFYMLIGTCPFPNQSGSDLIDGILGAKSDDWKQLSSACQDLLCRLLEYRWEKRGNLLEIETHEWMTEGKGKSFYPYTPPSRNHVLRSVVLQKLSRILRMEYKQLQGRVHEYRVDELSAMANLMMDDYLAMKDDYENRSESLEKSSGKSAAKNNNTKSPRYIPAKIRRERARTAPPDGRYIMRNSSPLKSDVGNCDGVHSGIHSVVRGRKVELRKGDKHSNCCSVQYGNAYKLQPEDDVEISEEKMSQILDEVLSEMPNVQSEMKKRKKKTSSNLRPLGNATSFNMAIARNLYEAKRRTGSPIVPSTRVTTPDHMMEAAVNIQGAESYSRDCQDSKHARLQQGNTHNKSSATKRPSTCSPIIRIISRNKKQTNNPRKNSSHSTLTVTVKVGSAKRKLRPKTAMRNERRANSAARSSKDNTDYERKQEYDSDQQMYSTAACDLGVVGDQASLNSRPYSSKSAASSKDCSLLTGPVASPCTTEDEDADDEDEVYDNDRNCSPVEGARDFKDDYNGEPMYNHVEQESEHLSSSRVTTARPRSRYIRSAVTKVPLSPSVVSLDAKGIAHNWKMRPGAIAPKKRLIHFMRNSSLYGSTAKSTNIPERRTHSAFNNRQVAQEREVYEKYFDYIDENHFEKKRRGAWPDSSSLDQYTSEHEEEQTGEEKPHSTTEQVDEKSRKPDTKPLSEKVINKEYRRDDLLRNDNSVKIKDLYRMLSEDLDNYLGRKVLGQNQPSFITATQSNTVIAAAAGKKVRSITPIVTKSTKSFLNNKPRTEKLATKKAPLCRAQPVADTSEEDIFKKYESIYEGFANIKSPSVSSRKPVRPSDQQKKSLHLKSAPAVIKRPKSSSHVQINPVVQRQSRCTHFRQLGHAPLGSVVSTCTACDLQELIPMTMLTSSFNRRKTTDDHVTIDITNQGEPDEIKLIVERMRNIDI